MLDARSTPCYYLFRGWRFFPRSCRFVVPLIYILLITKAAKRGNVRWWRPNKKWVVAKGSKSRLVSSVGKQRRSLGSALTASLASKCDLLLLHVLRGKPPPPNSLLYFIAFWSLFLKRNGSMGLACLIAVYNHWVFKAYGGLWAYIHSKWIYDTSAVKL